MLTDAAHGFCPAPGNSGGLLAAGSQEDRLAQLWSAEPSIRLPLLL